MIQLIGIVAGVAQLVEQLIRNQQVRGSSPLTSSIKREIRSLFFVYFRNFGETYGFMQSFHN